MSFYCIFIILSQTYQLLRTEHLATIRSFWCHKLLSRINLFSILVRMFEFSGQVIQCIANIYQQIGNIKLCWDFMFVNFTLLGESAADSVPLLHKPRIRHPKPRLLRVYHVATIISFILFLHLIYWNLLTLKESLSIFSIYLISRAVKFSSPVKTILTFTKKHVSISINGTACHFEWF